MNGLTRPLFWSVVAFVACLVYSLSVSVFVLCLDRCLFYESATWAQAAAKDKAAITGGLFRQPLSHIVISHPICVGLDLSPDPH